MKSFETLYSELQEHTGDDSATQLARFKKHINETMHGALGNRNWKFLEKTGNLTSVAETARYTLQANVNKIMEVAILNSDDEVDSLPEPVEDAGFWNKLQYRKAGSSDYPRYFYQEGNDLLLWPAMATADLSIKVRFREQVIDMSRADYTTGTIVSITKGASALVGDSTVWTGRKPLGEQWIRIAQTAGDYRWYRVDAIGSDTTITLEKKYLGTTIATGSSTYTLGEFPNIPQSYHSLLLYRPLALYYTKIENLTMAKHYWKLYDGGYEMGESRRIRGLLGKMISEQEGMLDASFYGKQGGNIYDPELLAKDNESTLG